jgi:hypothetical protein
MVDIPVWFRPKDFESTKDTTKLPPYFYLDWAGGTAQFYYTEKEMPASQQVHRVKLKDIKETIALCTNNDSILVPKNDPLKDSCESIMKSHLQKCVRRKETDLAVRTAKYFIDSHKVDVLLRRLFIITIEDTVLNPNICILTWLMMISNKYSFSDDVHAWILGYTRQISEIDTIDDFSYTDKDIVVDKKLLQRISRIRHHSPLVCLIIRHNYGGMDGDREMCLQHMYKWLERMEQNKDLGIMPIKPVSMNTVKTIKKEDMLLEAFDFHCCSVLEDLQKVSKYDEATLKKLIWDHSSSINKRKTNKPTDPNWELLKPTFLTITKKYRNNLLVYR